MWAGEEEDFEGVMGGFGRKTCKKEKGMEDHIEGGGIGWDSIIDRMVWWKLEIACSVIGSISGSM